MTEGHFKQGKDTRRAHGGSRACSGRKKKQATILKELAIEKAHTEAEKSLQFCVDTRDNEKVSSSIRLSAAQEIMDRVWGKAKQAVTHEGNIGITLVKLVKTSEKERGLV